MQAVILKMDRMADLGEKGIYNLQIPLGKNKFQEKSLRAIHISGFKLDREVDMYVVFEDPTMHEAFENGAKLTNLVLEDIMHWEVVSGWVLIGRGIVRIFKKLFGIKGVV